MRKHTPSALARALHALSRGKKKASIDAMITSVVSRYGLSGKLAFLRKVEAALAQSIQEERGTVKGVARIVRGDEKIARTLTADLSKRIGHDIDLSVIEDPSLIAGTVVTIGDHRYDGSVKRRIARLKEYMAI